MGFLEQVRAAGVVGCGGAGFPAHAKFAAPTERLIINAAECEPLLRTDRWIAVNEADQVIRAVAAAREQLGAAEAVIALKEQYTAEIAALTAAVGRAGEAIRFHRLAGFYPAGDEQALVYEVTGRVVPPGGLPLDVGCVVSNVGTMAEVSRALDGQPFVDRLLTVAGAVAEPCMVRAPIGTPFLECLRLAGGLTEAEDIIIVSGGPLMGKPMTLEAAETAYVGKTTSGILALPARAKLWQCHTASDRQVRTRAAAACIQCSFCTQLCPRWLMGHPLEPHQIMRRFGGGRALEEMLDDPVIRAAQYCCECGVCELIACPMRLQPRKVNTQIKRALAAKGVRPTKGESGLSVRPFREERKIPTAGAAARAGAGAYYSTELAADLREATPERVCASLRGHIGAPALPAVRKGERVTRGQLIGEIPEGKLGARYQAPIDGTVAAADSGTITIDRG
ncbi:MAG: SLBB domain-containing protein [Oscillospiraceae bacterium]|jgi:Na+-translocating ferredoxin:NAD+ oxidoreductase RnfC subunit|nr:SLBB domain-containing protein [Oscillospiraceae bacterium]